jgi:hypothetical protein
MECHIRGESGSVQGSKQGHSGSRAVSGYVAALVACSTAARAEIKVARPGIGGIRTMSRLEEVLGTLGLTAETSLDGRWIKLRGARCAVYVVEAAWGTGYYTWCDDPCDRTVEFYRDPHVAIRAGLRRAECPDAATAANVRGNMYRVR